MENFKTPTSANQKNNFTPIEAQAQHYDMVVFCHLRWEFVYQRPQHIISRMAADMKILFVEEPVAAAEGDTGTGNLNIINDNLHVLQPKTGSIENIAGILPEYIKNKHVGIGWFYSGSFSPLLGTLKFDTVVYDCMDELSLFKGAPQYLIDQEKYLLANADIVFTGGKSLYNSKKGMHSNVYCFPSSVDENHFAKALNGLAVPEEIMQLQTPVVGYFGVIDERLDLELLSKTAALLPEVSFVMIGPLAKIQESDLPKAANIHYTGMKSYNELPNYLKGFDIAMMPFALNDATKYISPTKTLEYMAAGKPIISTRIKDVVTDYSECVAFAANENEFEQAILLILSSTNDGSRNRSYRDILDKTSWNATASNMKQIILQYTK